MTLTPTQHAHVAQVHDLYEAGDLTFDQAHAWLDMICVTPRSEEELSEMLMVVEEAWFEAEHGKTRRQ